MRLILDESSEEVKELYTLTFVNREMSQYEEQICQLHTGSDGEYYCGYLWDYLKAKQIRTYSYCTYFLLDKTNLYVFWDQHSADRIFKENYWKFPRNAVVKIDGRELVDNINLFPEDIYIFDESLSWSIVFTHEFSDRGRRLCFFLNIVGE